MRPPMFGGKGGPGARMSDMTKSVDKPQNMLVTIRRIFSYWKEHAWWLFVMVLGSIVEVGCSLLSPILIGKAIDDSINLTNMTVDFDKLNHILFLLICVYVTNSIFTLLQQYGMTIITLKISEKVRTQLMDKMQELSVKFFDSNLRGDLMSRFTSDVELMKSGLGDSFIQVFSTIFTLTGTIISMIALSPALTVLCVMMIPFVFIISNVVVSKTRKYFSNQQKALGELNSLVEESVGGIKVVRSFGLEDRQIAAFNEANEKLRSSGVKAQIFSGLLMPLMRVLENIIYIIVAVCGGYLAANNGVTVCGIALAGISVGTIQSFLLYTRHFLRPINGLASQLNSVQSAIAGAERIFAILDTKPDIVNKENALVLKEKDIKGEVVFDHVSFGYDDSKLILKDVSFSAKQDEVIAIVGSTGAGKTTIINLLTRFYDINSGKITIDGIDIRDVTKESLRDQMGIVLQTPFLFTDTVKYNVSYGWPVATEAEIESATIAANADSFVRRLPEGYNTVLLRGGENISHGQKQLLTIARAILVETPILVFDEATSNIDTHTELLIQKAINNLTKGRTSFVIAHRLSTVKNADKILVMHEGRIVEQGKHEELLSLKGRYYEIYNSQFTVSTD
ncbi:MAG: ABC transporter ATP-binding protein/permease [Paludibacteraceae bacterium]|nr:ABC transporter ATP-binding protein/permease [Paludibacteraceae bacterium]